MTIIVQEPSKGDQRAGYGYYYKDLIHIIIEEGREGWVLINLDFADFNFG